MKGFVVCYATSLSVAIGSLKGIPLSTTHCVIGAMFGVFVAGKFRCVHRVYNLPDSPENEKEVGVDDDIDIIFADDQAPIDSLKMNFDTIKLIIIWCLITIPSSFTFSALTCFILKWVLA